MKDSGTARRPHGPGNRWELVWSHRDELLEMARSRSASAEEAEDAVQEAMIRAVEDPDVPYGRVRSWLRLATVRACADRRRQVARDSELSESLSAAHADPPLVEEAACDRAEARWLAARSAELLPERQAEALRLHSQDLDVAQVARTMGLSYRATESLLARARRSVRNALAGSLTLAMAVWLSVRRFPRTGITQQAVAASAAVTVAVVGLNLPADSPVRPESRPPADRAVPRAVEAPAPRMTPGGSPTPSASPDSTDRSVRDHARPAPSEQRRTSEPSNAAAVEMEIGFGERAPVLRSVAISASIPSLPLDVPENEILEVPPVPVDISAERPTAPTGPSGPDHTDRQGVLSR
ncbi:MULTISPECIES: sigma-70 family RNA polymerase sigma factor [unclassified Streptomyces]|uniref:RNA polymerase sigma factor n=1 Tax=unclassified Streptomyces TaxID=2593676 RepID=UPI0035DFBEFF